jgi:hypothetical protein
VNASQHELGATANEALVVIAPLDKLRVARRLLFDLLACHNLHVSLAGFGPVQMLVEEFESAHAVDRMLAGEELDRSLVADAQLVTTQ